MESMNQPQAVHLEGGRLPQTSRLLDSRLLDSEFYERPGNVDENKEQGQNVNARTLGTQAYREVLARDNADFPLECYNAQLALFT